MAAGWGCVSAQWPVIRASADQARLGRAGRKGSSGKDPIAMSTSSTGAGASGRPELTLAECPHQHACERGAGGCLTPGLELKRLRNWTRKIQPLSLTGQRQWPSLLPVQPVLGHSFPLPSQAPRARHPTAGDLQQQVSDYPGGSAPFRSGRCRPRLTGLLLLLCPPHFPPETTPKPRGTALTQSR